jgi:hypothetical protein
MIVTSFTNFLQLGKWFFAPRGWCRYLFQMMI